MDEGKEIIVAASSAATKAGVEKLSGGMANFFAPHIAKKQAEAMQIKLQSMIDAEEKAKRAGYRIIWEQSNIESIAREIPEHMSPNSDDAEKAEKLRNMNPDVAARSADSCKHVSDKYMRTLWAKALAGEADNPGSFSIRTARILGDMRQEDAEMFRTFCQFIWIEKNWRENFPVSLVYDHQKSVYTDSGITYAALDDLETMGLISHKTQGYARWYPLPSNGAVWNYQGKVDFSLEPQKHPEKNSAFISCGNAALTREGRQLFAVCRDQVWYNAKFMLYVVGEWRARNFNPTHLSDTGDAGKFGG